MGEKRNRGNADKKSGPKGKGGWRSRVRWQAGIGILCLGGLSACGIFRPAKAEREAFRAEVRDSLRWRSGKVGSEQVSAKSLRRGAAAWQEICLSPPDSAGRQYIRRIQTAAACVVAATASEDTVSVRSFREATQGRRSLQEGTRRLRAKPECGWMWIGGGLLLAFLFYRRARRAG